jgi:hypothetical protein
MVWLKENVGREMKRSRIKRAMPYIKKIRRGLSTTGKKGKTISGKDAPKFLLTSPFEI